MNLLPLFKKYGSVSTDTRKIKKGDIFFALKGANFDGNKFAAQALDAGASIAIIDDPAFYPAQDQRYVLVEDVLKSLQELSTEWRKDLGLNIFGLTGSNGKTTTKELLASVLGTEKKIYATAGNFNNHIGVPLTLLSIKEGIELAIVEMGANQPGDIKELAEIAMPDMGLITNVGHAHLEKLGNLEGVRITKGALFDFVGGQEGSIFVNVADPNVKLAAQPYPNQITYGTPEADYYYELVNNDLHEMKLRVFGHRWDSPLELKSRLTGSYNCMNILAASAVAAELGVSREGIQEGIWAYQSTNNRSQVIKKGELTIWMDAYNANPTSMKAAIQHILSEKGSNTGLILGDMYELGDEEAEMHREIGQFASSLKAKLFIGVGPRMRHAVEGYSGENGHWFADKEALIGELGELIRDIDTLLIKGSRSMAMEKLLDKL
ncbi:MAG: UDP-N-acetylmuramoyl-tripeptide--D-alanyl-D-alanine ligase [Bacteroidia bacterium]|nr:UDP-N-acetylmuramoyl-tripeptide--D-alanyl-D-alanine ligase [Bacteroidia bacterium]